MKFRLLKFPTLGMSPSAFRHIKLFFTVLSLAAASAPAASHAQLTYSPTSATFAPTPVSSTSVTQTFTVTNGSSSAVTPSSPTISANFAVAATPANTCSGTSIPANSTCSISVDFVPTAAGTLTGTLSLTASGTAYTDPLSGVGLSATAPATSFPAENVAATESATVTFTFSAATTLTSSSVSVLTQGNTGYDFSSGTQLGTACKSGAYAKNATCTVVVNFKAGGPGKRMGAVALYNNAATPVIIGTAYLQGTGNGADSVFFPGTGTTSIYTGANNFVAPNVDVAGNIYMGDSCCVYKVPAGSTTPTILASNGGGAATNIDGAGNLYYGIYGNIYELPFGTTTPVLIAVLTGGNDNSMMVDAAGNLFIPGYPTHGIYEVAVGTHAVTTYIAAGAPTSDGGTLGRTIGTYMDAAGDIYLADFDNSKVDEVLAGTTTVTVIQPPDAYLNYPYSIVVDPAGDLFVSNYYGQPYLLKYSHIGSSYSVAQYSAINASYGVTLDSNENLVLVEGDVLTRYTRSATPPLAFAAAVVGSTSSSQSVNLQNEGNAALTFTSIAPSSTNFSLSNSTCATSTPLTTGNNCNIVAAFTPQTSGNLTGTANITGNNLAAATETQMVNLTGTADYQLAFTSGPPANLQNAQNAGTVAVSVENSTGGVVTSQTPSVTLTVTNTASYSQTYTATAVNGVATFNLSTYPLATGTYTYTATIPSSTFFNSATASETVYPYVLAFSPAIPTPVAANSASSAVTVVIENNSGGSTTQTSPITLTVTGPNSYSQTYGPTAASASNGSVTFTVAGITVAGTYTYTATSSGLTSAASNQVVNGAVAVSLTITPASTTAHIGFPDNFTVTAYDTYGNVANTTTDTIKLTSTDTAATLPANFALSAGTATEPVTFGTFGTFTVTATDQTNASVPPVTSGNISVNPIPVYTVTVAADDSASPSAANCNDVSAGATPLSTCSLRDAITAVNALNNTSSTSYVPTIIFASSLYGSTITMQAVTNLTGNLALIGPGINGADAITLSGGGTVGFLIQNSASIVTFTGLAFKQFNSNYGGVLYVTPNTGPVTLTNDSFTGNVATQNGGVMNDGSPVTITGCTFTGNSAASLGGALAQGEAGSYIITNSVFTSNSAAQGGAIFVGATGSAVTTLTNDSFLQNTATTNGGAVYNSQTLAVSGSYFYGNKVNGSVSASGGALYQTAGYTANSISGSAFIGNSLTSTGSLAYGGGVYAYGGTMSNTLLYKNTASGATISDGGGAYLNGVTLTGVTITGNSVATGTTADGGGLYAVGADYLYNVTVTGNSAKTAGGVYRTVNLYAYNTVISGNTATGSYRDEDGVVSSGNNYLDSSTNVTCTANCTPYLSVLGNYGGPVIGAPGGLTATTPAQATGSGAAAYQSVATFTMLPLPGSPLLAAASGSYLNTATTDARGAGYPRSTLYAGATHYDIGAVNSNYSLGFTTQPANTASGQTITAKVQLYETGNQITADQCISTSTPACYPGTQSPTMTFAVATGTLGATSAALTAGVSTLSTTITGSPTGNDTLSVVAKSSFTGTPTVANATSTDFNLTDGANPTLNFIAPPNPNVANGNNACNTASTASCYLTVGLYATGSSTVNTTSSALVTLTVSATGYTTQTYTANAMNGVATFSLGAIGLTTSATYTYAATASTYTSDTATATQIVSASTSTIGSFTFNSLPTNAFSGVSYTFTVTALNASGTTDTAFTGNVILSSTDSAATFLPPNYTFNTSNAGMHTFTVTFATPGLQTITATTDGGQTGTSSNIKVITNYVWLVNATGTIDKLSESGAAVTGAVGNAGTSSTLGSVAFDSSGNVWSVTNTNNTLDFLTTGGTGATTYSGGGLNAPVAVAVDGSGYIWVVNSGTNTISEFNSSGTAQSGTAGFGSAWLGTSPSAIAIDKTGGLWVTSKTGNSVAHILGAATPVTTPMATAVANGTVGTKP